MRHTDENGLRFFYERFRAVGTFCNVENVACDFVFVSVLLGHKISEVAKAKRRSRS